MGTRSVTQVVDQDGAVYVSLYQQYDGYPDGVGKDLAEFLENAVVGNGIKGGESRNFFNGVGDLACRVISLFKSDSSDIGGQYIVAPPADPQEFNYVVTAADARGFDSPEGGVTLKVSSYDKVLFSGTPEEFLYEYLPRAEEEDY